MCVMGVVGGGSGDEEQFSMLLAGFQAAASWSSRIAAASQSAVGTCGTGGFRVVFFRVRINSPTCSNEKRKEN